MPERIVVLDGYTLSRAKPGDADTQGEPGWDPFEVIGEVTVHDRTPADLILERSQGAAVLLTNKTPLAAETIAALPDLRYIGVLATGVNVVDLEATARADVVVSNVPNYGGDAVAQHVFALLLTLTNRVAEHDAAVREGAWTACPDFCFTVGPIVELAGKTLGVIGAGDIGRRVARIGHAFGMDVLVQSRTQHDPGVPAEWAELDDVFARSDVVTLHVPLTERTHQLVNSERLELMKPTAFLINTARGPLVDERALADALTTGRIAGAAVDVLSVEPPTADNPLLTAPNCVVTPHNAWAAVETRSRLMQIAADNLRAFLGGEPVNVVI